MRGELSQVQRKDSTGGGWCVEEMGCGVLSSVWGGLCKGRTVCGEDSVWCKLCLEPSVVRGARGEWCKERAVHGEDSAKGGWCMDVARGVLFSARGRRCVERALPGKDGAQKAWCMERMVHRGDMQSVAGRVSVGSSGCPKQD